ncbi:hypothetical protein GGF50DRAFT_119595 [Schizophyllum commune]
MGIAHRVAELVLASFLKAAGSRRRRGVSALTTMPALCSPTHRRRDVWTVDKRLALDDEKRVALAQTGATCPVATCLGVREDWAPLARCVIRPVLAFGRCRCHGRTLVDITRRRPARRPHASLAHMSLGALDALLVAYTLCPGLALCASSSPSSASWVHARDSLTSLVDEWRRQLLGDLLNARETLRLLSRGATLMGIVKGPTRPSGSCASADALFGSGAAPNPQALKSSFIRKC